MKITGIVAEYNPFHNGHKYQIDTIKRNGGAVAAVMSGNVVQRGDTAVFDKHTRAECAVMCGVDLVLELPCVYALGTAQRFAQGAVSTLEALGCVDELCFGSECGDINALSAAADIIENEPQEVSEKIQQYISLGSTYPSARQRAFEGIIQGGILSEPNNILALEYIRALRRINSAIIPMTIKRNAANYHDTAPNGSFASATAVRTMLQNNEDISRVIPREIVGIYESSAASDRERLFPLLYYAVRTFGTEGMKSIAEVSEGLENRIFKECGRSSSFDVLAERIKTKRYTLTRINRALMCVLLGITDDMTSLKPEYIRVLAMNETGTQVLAQSKETRTLPVITKPSAFSEQSVIWEREVYAGDVVRTAFGEYGFGLELSRSPVFVK